jgi:hypothetical protein
MHLTAFSNPNSCQHSSNSRTAFIQTSNKWGVKTWVHERVLVSVLNRRSCIGLLLYVFISNNIHNTNSGPSQKHSWSWFDTSYIVFEVNSSVVKNGDSKTP